MIIVLLVLLPVFVLTGCDSGGSSTCGDQYTTFCPPKIDSNGNFIEGSSSTNCFKVENYSWQQCNGQQTYTAPTYTPPTYTPSTYTPSTYTPPGPVTAAIAINPAAAPVEVIASLSRVALYNLEDGNLDEAESFAADALLLDPNDSRLVNLYGVILLASGNRSGAAAEFEQALRLNPLDGAARFNLDRLRSP